MLKPCSKLSICLLLVLGLAACAGKPEKPVIVIEKTSNDALPVLTEAEKQSYREALEFMAQQTYDKAEVLFTGLVQKQPRLTGAYVNLAVIRKQQDQLDDAMRLLSEALKINPNFIDALLQQALIFQDRGEFTKAEDLLRRAEAINPDHPLVNYNLGVLYELYLQDYPLAIKYYKRYVSISAQADDVETVQRWIMLLERK
jgi:tetratricopeptide (TPR) repeat protein